MDNIYLRLPSGGADVSPTTATKNDVLETKVIIGPDGYPITGAIPVIGSTVSLEASAISSDGSNIHLTAPVGNYFSGGKVKKSFASILSAQGASEYCVGQNIPGSLWNDASNIVLTPSSKSYMNGGGVYKSVDDVLNAIGATRKASGTINTSIDMRTTLNAIINGASSTKDYYIGSLPTLGWTPSAAKFSFVSDSNTFEVIRIGGYLVTKSAYSGTTEIVFILDGQIAMNQFITDMTPSLVPLSWWAWA